MVAILNSIQRSGAGLRKYATFSQNEHSTTPSVETRCAAHVGPAGPCVPSKCVAANIPGKPDGRGCMKRLQIISGDRMKFFRKASCFYPCPSQGSSTLHQNNMQPERGPCKEKSFRFHVRFGSTSYGPIVWVPNSESL